VKSRCFGSHKLPFGEATGTYLRRSGVSSVSMSAYRLETFGSLLGTVWCVVGPLVGVVIGAWLARSWQHKDRPLGSYFRVGRLIYFHEN